MGDFDEGGLAGDLAGDLVLLTGPLGDLAGGCGGRASS